MSPNTFPSRNGIAELEYEPKYLSKYISHHAEDFPFVFGYEKSDGSPS